MFILESSAEPCDTEGLTGKTAANKVDIRQGVWVNGSCVCKIQFSFRGVHGVIRLLCVFVYLAVADALKTAEPFKPRPKATDACEHIQKSDWHRSSDRYRCFFCSASLSLHRHTEALGLVLILGFLIVAVVALTFARKAVFCGFLVRFRRYPLWGFRRRFGSHARPVLGRVRFQ